MLATVAPQISAAVAGQQQYTSRMTDTGSEDFEGWSTLKFAEDTNLCDFSDFDKVFAFDKDAPSTPGLIWDSDANSTASESPLGSVFEDWDDYEIEMDESGSQTIDIPANAQFYIPHPEPRPFDFAPFSDPTFLDPDDPSCSDVDMHAQLASGDPEEPMVASENPVIIVHNVDGGYLEGTSEELSNQSGWFSMRTCLSSQISRKAVPDVPIDFMAEDDLIEASTPITISGSTHLLPSMASSLYTKFS